MAHNFKINIADIIISLIAEKRVRIIKEIAPYCLFLTEGKPEVTLRFQDGSYSLPDRKLTKEIVFDSQPTWRLFYSDRKYILETRDNTTVLSSNFASGEVYTPDRRRIPPFTYPQDEVLMINLLGKSRGILVHACGVKDNRVGGLLFAGTSGDGKSTLANLWNGTGGSGADGQQSEVTDTTILSDDRIIIRKTDGLFWIFGTPWHGDVKACSPEKSPLNKIFFLEHASKNYVRDVKRVEAVSKLLVRSFPPFWDGEGMEFTLQFIEEVTREVPCYDLGFVPDKSAIDFIKSI